VGLFKRDEAQVVGRIFAWFYKKGFWIEDPRQWQERIMGDELLLTALDYWHSVYQYKVPTNVEKELRKIKEDLSSESPSYDNLTQVYQKVLVTLGFEKLDHTDPNDATIMANMGRFNNLLTDYETANRIGGRKTGWRAYLKGLCWFMNSYAALAYDEPPSEDIRGVDAVQIMTVHQAKGLEWPVVFLFSTVNERFPPKGIGRKLRWCDVPRNLFDAQRYEGNLEDERRLFYVAITRAKDALIISYFKHLNRDMRRSTFIDNLEPSVVTRLTTSTLPYFYVSKSEDTEDMLTFSAGEITAYLRCPYMFLLRKVYGYQPQLAEAIGYGKGVHYCLRMAVEFLKKDKNLDPIKAAEIAVNNEFFMPFVTGEILESFKKGARKCVLNYAKKYGKDLSQSSEVEYRIEFPVHNATITGRIDVLGNKEVRDYKTMDYSEVAMENLYG